MSKFRPKRVFISYSHESARHKDWVLRLADRLRSNGVDAWLDRYTPPPAEGWIRWMQRQIETADFVVLVCTPTYRRRFEGKEPDSAGLGATWEGVLANQILYDDRGRNRSFIPVLPPSGDSRHIPTALRPFAHYFPDTQYESLLRHIHGLPEVQPAPLGHSRVPPREVQSEGLLRSPPVWASEDFIQMTLRSPLHCQVSHSAAICTRRGVETPRWNVHLQSNRRLFQVGLDVPVQRAFLVLIEAETRETISLVAHTRLRLVAPVENGSIVRADDPIATLLIPKDNVKHPPFSASRGPEFAGILKYSPWIGDLVWRAGADIGSEGTSQQGTSLIVAYQVGEESGLVRVVAPAAGVFNLAGGRLPPGSQLALSDPLGTVVQGATRYEVRAPSDGILVSGALRENEAVYAGQELFRLRVGPPLLAVTLRPAQTDRDGWYELLAPLPARWLQPKDMDGEVASAPGTSFGPGKELGRLEAGDIIVAVSLDLEGVVMQVYPDYGNTVTFGERLVLVRARRLFLRAPLIGTFYRSPQPAAAHFVEIGSRVREGETLCIIEHLKLENYIAAPAPGIVEEIKVKNGQPVEYGEILFVINLEDEPSE